jgi:hypothetical protein
LMSRIVEFAPLFKFATQKLRFAGVTRGLYLAQRKTIHQINQH